MTARTDGPDAARATRPATPVRSGGPARRSGLVRRHGSTRSGGVPPERAVRPVLGDDERGSGTALSASIIVVLCVTAFWVLVLSGWIASDQRARQAADLAALAGAHAHEKGASACDAAREYAQRNGGELADCDVSAGGGEYIVHVEVSVELRPALAGAPSRVNERAHAGFLVPDEDPAARRAGPNVSESAQDEDGPDG
ncbi:Rv3654c family TadE-like protein [Propionibacterium acidifaciens]|uniref:Rv3654c family TadE-like protein n=1 Tax=Propionibacterium acidifaciens TaxID=556499 RepID=UPI0023F166DB|nr:Rv3654c family TadE-like protein [Propionibacterium acidifaciens]